MSVNGQSQNKSQNKGQSQGRAATPRRARETPRSWPPRRLGDVSLIVETAAAWAAEQDDVYGLEVSIVELPAGGGPVVRLRLALRPERGPARGYRFQATIHVGVDDADQSPSRTRSWLRRLLGSHRREGPRRAAFEAEAEVEGEEGGAS